MKFVNLDRYYSYNDLVSDASMLRIAYPDFIHTEVLGTSVLNRSIIMFRVGRGSKGIILTSGVHGRESVNPIVLMAMMEEYADVYYDKRNTKRLKDEEYVTLTEFFDEYSLYMVPLVNPDGYMVALSGYDMIHNEEMREHAIETGIPAEEWKYNARSIDINRNFPSKNWVKKFKGDMPASEPETRAIMRMFREVNSEGYIDYHSRGEVIYYYRRQMSKEYNEKQLEIAERLAKVTGYSLMPPEEEIVGEDSGGNTVHYYSEHHKRPAITIETVPEDAGFPLDTTYQGITYHQILNTPFCII